MYLLFVNIWSIRCVLGFWDRRYSKGTLVCVLSFSYDSFFLNCEKENSKCLFGSCKYVNLLVNKIDSSNFGQNWRIFCTQSGLYWSSTACFKAQCLESGKWMRISFRHVYDRNSYKLSLARSSMHVLSLDLTEKEISFWLLEIPGVL